MLDASHNVCRISLVQSTPCDMTLELPEIGLRLRFHGVSQRLQCIDVPRLNHLPLSYTGQVFCGPTVVPSLALLDRVFGPTYALLCLFYVQHSTVHRVQ